MPEPAVRVVLVVVIAAAALIVVLVAPRRAAGRAGRSPVDLSGIEGRVVFFTSASCRRCDAIRDVLRATGARFTEIRYEDDPARFDATGVGAVPLLVGRTEQGVEVRRLAGRAASRKIRAFLEASGAWNRPGGPVPGVPGE